MSNLGRIRSGISALIIPSLFLLLGVRCEAKAKPVAGGEAPPQLVVVVVVDQMRADYLTRWQGHFTGGLHRMITEGALFTNAVHDHAATLTATGHATIATGCLPSQHGITGNKFWERDSVKSVGAVEDKLTMLVGGSAGTGASPKRLLRQSIGDWLKLQSPNSKVVSASLKDRAAVLLGGFKSDGVYWYDPTTGNFVSSTHYLETLPPSVTSFNNSGAKDSWTDSSWTKFDSLLPYQGLDSVPDENDGIHVTFPHAISPNGDTSRAKYYDGLWETPFADALLLQFGADLIVHNEMGVDSIADILMLSLSAADLIGHSYGPDSHEIQDYYLRLDKYFGEFLGVLDTVVGRNNYLIVMTSDHGACPFPSFEKSRGNDQGRRVLSKEYKHDVAAALTAEFPRYTHVESLLISVSGGFVIDTAAAQRYAVNDSTLTKRAAKAIESIPYVANVFTYHQLSAITSGNRPYERLFRNSFHPDRAPDLTVRLREWVYIMDSARGTTHGTPYHYDTGVPLLFFGATVRGGSNSSSVRTIDIPPTIAKMLGIAVPPDIDGKSLDNLK
jgi:predicted AlkP superfamily pyrophosphatase or phosphodiesterase